MFNFLRGLMSVDEPPTKVLEVRSDSYAARTILYREGSMILYGPAGNTKSNNIKDNLYEIVMQRPLVETLSHTYSLFRSETREQAEDRFIAYKDKVPLFAQLTKDASIANMQRICDTIGEQPSWSIAHVAAHFLLVDLFNHAAVREHLDAQECLAGATPVMTAIRTGNVRLVQSLIAIKCNLELVDFNGDSVFHYAAGTTKEIIAALALACQNKELVDAYNKTGLTALHVACRNDKPDCVRALLLAGADVNLGATPGPASGRIARAAGNVGDFLQDPRKKLSEEDMKHGGTPLHWATSREVVEALVSQNCDINSLNFDERSALHVMAQRGRLECLIALLAHGVSVNQRDKDGNTALHLASTLSSLPVVQALIVFGADLNLLNNNGHSARHLVPVQLSNSIHDHILYCLHAVGAKRCSTDVSNCGPGCADAGTYAGVPVPNSSPTSPDEPARAEVKSALHKLLNEMALKSDGGGSGRLLCLDGGGIRGLVLIQILLAIEEVLQKPIVHCFDFVAGTSTGGIIALALAVGRTLSEVQMLYFRLKDIAFVGSRPYPSEPLENILKEYLGCKTIMSDIKHPKLMILGVVADRKPVDLHIFRNYESPTNLMERHMGIRVLSEEGQLVWEAARATGAAPSYFRAYKRYLDGGLIGNNPSLDALTELRDLRAVLKSTGRVAEANLLDVKVVVSCGTGIPPTSKVKDFDVFKPESLFDTARLALGLSALGALLVDQATQAEGRVVERARAWCGSLGAAYLRFSPRLSRDVAMDERSDAILIHMLWETKAYMQSNLNKTLLLRNLLDKD